MHATPRPGSASYTPTTHLETGEHGHVRTVAGSSPRHPQVSENAELHGHGRRIAGLGIGATTAIYDIFERVITDPLPVKELERLVSVYTAVEDGYEFSSQPIRITSITPPAMR